MVSSLNTKNISIYNVAKTKYLGWWARILSSYTVYVAGNFHKVKISRFCDVIQFAKVYLRNCKISTHKHELSTQKSRN